MAKASTNKAPEVKPEESKQAAVVKDTTPPKTNNKPPEALPQGLKSSINLKKGVSNHDK